MNNQKFSAQLQARLLNFSVAIGKYCRLLSVKPFFNEYLNQLKRSSSSIGANYLEATETESIKDFIHKIKISRKEAKETQYWLELLENINDLDKTQLSVFRAEVTEFVKIFSSIINKMAIKQSHNQSVT